MTGTVTAIRLPDAGQLHLLFSRHPSPNSSPNENPSGSRCKEEPIRRSKAVCRIPVSMDVGIRLADLAPKLRALFGRGLSLDAEIGYPCSLVRMDGDQFDAVIMLLVDNALAGGAGNIHVRTRMAGARIWLLIGADGHAKQSLEASHAPSIREDRDHRATDISQVHDFTRATHSQLRIRERPRVGKCFALVLPTMLGVAGNRSLSVAGDLP